MRSLLVLLLVAAAAAAPAAEAQPPVFGQSYQVRLARGDIPTTSAEEPAGEAWNVAQSVRVHHATGQETQVSIPVPNGFGLLSIACACPGNGSAEPSGLRGTWTLPAAAASGDYTVNLTATQRNVNDMALVPIVTDARWFREGDWVVVVYAPQGAAPEAPVAADREGLPCTAAPCAIHTYTGSAAQPFPPAYVLVRHPIAAATPDAPDGAFDWLALAIGLAAGIALWAFLVQRGAVQRRGRKQVAQAAAHEALATAEPKPVLEGRKRLLMAALKELEMAKMSQEVDAAAYDTLKADFKKQAVTVMRALEGAGEGPAPEPGA